MSTSQRVNTTSAHSPMRSPTKHKGDLNNFQNQSVAGRRSENMNGKEFVLEELTGGDVGDDPSDGNYNNNIPSGEQYTAPEGLNKEQLPEVLAGALDHIVGQLDMMTRTLAIIDKRLSLQEDLMARHITNVSEGKLEENEQMLEMMFTSGGGGTDFSEINEGGGGQSVEE